MEKVFKTKDILNMLPHRYPFLLIDKVIEIEPGKRAVGIKNTTINELYFQGHFPESPIVPGVLIIESLAQLTAIIYCSGLIKADNSKDTKDKISEHVGYLVGIDKFRFKRLVEPGEQILLYGEIREKYEHISKVDVKAMVGKDVVAKGSITVTEK